MKSEFSTCSQALAASHTPSNGSAQQELFAPSHFASETGSVKPSCESTGPTRQSTTMCEPSTLTENATSSRAATHASATVEQTPNEMAKACGRGHSDRSAGTDLFTLFEKMFLETSTREPLNNAAKPSAPEQRENPVLTGPDGLCWMGSDPPVLRRIDDVPARLDRIRSLGNSICPPIVEQIGRAILVAEQ